MFPVSQRLFAVLDRCGFVACLLLPVALLHARAVAEVLIAVIDISFLAQGCSARGQVWVRHRVLWVGGLWWGWVVACSLIGSGGVLMAVLAIRLPLLGVAVAFHVATPRRAWVLWAVLVASAGWIMVESWQQYLTGFNWLGLARYRDGALTGPFEKPRAGPAFILIFFPALWPCVMALLGRPGWGARAAGVGLAVLAVVTMLLIGQRMPSALMIMGLVLSGLLIPRLRPALCVVGVAGLVLLASLPMVSPPTYRKLVVHFADQLGHFSDSPYGHLFGHAAGLVVQHPWFGQGFDGFRRACALVPVVLDPAHPGMVPLEGMNGCSLHPHNYYLEQAVNGGVPGLLLFCAMVGVILWGCVGSAAAFIGLVLAFWPVASTSAFTALPNAGWVFLVVGLGLVGGATGGPASPKRDAGYGGGAHF